MINKELPSSFGCSLSERVAATLVKFFIHQTDFESRTKNFDKQESCTHIGNVHVRWTNFEFTELISSFEPDFGRSLVMSHSCVSILRISSSRNEGARRFLARFLIALWLCSWRKLENIPFTRAI